MAKSKFRDRLSHAWNAFIFQDKHPDEVVKATSSGDFGGIYTSPPSRTRLRVSNERSIIGAIYTRLGIDVAAIPIKHVRVDSNGRYLSDMNTSLEDCLTVEANIDQGARAFRQDIAMTLFDQGVAAIVPVDTTLNPLTTGGYDVNSMRVGQVMQWKARSVCVRVYNDQKGIKQDIWLPKDMVAIVENPLYSVMNEYSSTLQRLIRKLNLLDAVDEQSASGNLDIIIQLPYVIKTEARRQEAEKRLKEIEYQLKGSQYGIAYTDGTEKITQLNRPAENNLMNQIQYLTTMLYGQLGITDAIMNGTADELSMLNYFNRTVEPILGAITEAIKRTFLTKTARSQGQSIMYLRDSFGLVPVADLAEIADKFRRNEILSANDMRAIIGMPPSSDPKANQLLNPNLPVDQTILPVNGATVKPPPRTEIPQVPDPTAATAVAAKVAAAKPPLNQLLKQLPAIPQGVSQNGSP
jgi:putative sterol carrier protein